MQSMEQKSSAHATHATLATARELLWAWAPLVKASQLGSQNAGLCHRSIRVPSSKVPAETSLAELALEAIVHAPSEGKHQAFKDLGAADVDRRKRIEMSQPQVRSRMASPSMVKSPC
jgi:hypothetical protein